MCVCVCIQGNIIQQKKERSIDIHDNTGEHTKHAAWKETDTKGHCVISLSNKNRQCLQG